MTIIDTTSKLRIARDIARIHRMQGEAVRIMKHVVTNTRLGVVDTYYTVEAR